VNNFNFFLSPLFCRSVANRINQTPTPSSQISEDVDVEMASIAEDELLNVKFSQQGTSTGKVSGRKKIVS
jgi:RAC serine/threonine-protein kinase